MIHIKQFILIYSVQIMKLFVDPLLTVLGNSSFRQPTLEGFAF